MSHSARVITSLSTGLENETDDRLGGWEAGVCLCFYPSSHDFEVRIIKRQFHRSMQELCHRRTLAARIDMYLHILNASVAKRELDTKIL